MSVCCIIAETGTVDCDFSDIDVCGYTDESNGEIAWTRYYHEGLS